MMMMMMMAVQLADDDDDVVVAFVGMGVADDDSEVAAPFCSTRQSNIREQTWKEESIARARTSKEQGARAHFRASMYIHIFQLGVVEGRCPELMPGNAFPSK
mmetsp:Transcript_8090/g.11666  ORF Transcript_8090/g.11666 Transcript_8090/m.11666 type:complete len:102 (-) Transcript_8090:19-324(-)